MLGLFYSEKTHTKNIKAHLRTLRCAFIILLVLYYSKTISWPKCYVKQKAAKANHMAWTCLATEFSGSIANNLLATSLAAALSCNTLKS